MLVLCVGFFLATRWCSWSGISSISMSTSEEQQTDPLAVAIEHSTAEQQTESQAVVIEQAPTEQQTSFEVVPTEETPAEPEIDSQAVAIEEAPVEPEIDSHPAVIEHSPGEEQIDSQAVAIEQPPAEQQTDLQAVAIEPSPEEQQTDSQAVAIEQAPIAPERQQETNSKAVVMNFNSTEFVPMDPVFSSHGKKGSWGWHLLSGEAAAQEILANQYVCNKPFEHCCLGQGRQQVVKMDPHKALWKLINTDDQSLQLGTFGDVLKHYPAGQSQDSMCSFAFFGDSLSSDSAMGAVCEALRMGYTLKSCDTLRMGAMGVYGDDLNYTCDENRYNDAPHFLLEKEDSISCPRVFIAFEQDIINNMAFMPPAIVELGGLAIFNWGVHCNTDDGCLEQVLTPILNNAADETYQNWRFMFREQEPQHFAFPGGVYPKSIATPEHHICSNFHGRINNWRNKEVANIIEARNLTKQIATLPISAALEPLVGLHYEGPLIKYGDCTHYVYDPHRLDVTWDALLTVLQIP